MDLQERIDSTVAALRAGDLDALVSGLAALAQRDDYQVPDGLYLEAFIRLRAASRQEAGWVLSQRAGTVHDTIGEAAEALATAQEREAGEAIVRAIEFLAHVSPAAENATAATTLTAALPTGLLGITEKGLMALVHERVPTPWWPELLAHARTVFAKADRWLDLLISAQPNTGLDDFTDAVLNLVVRSDWDGYVAWRCVEPLYPLVINVLTQNAEALTAATTDKKLRTLVRSLGRMHPGIAHLGQCLDTVNDEQYLVLHPVRRLGYEIRVSGVDHMESFQTLLHGGLHGDPQEGWLPAPVPSQAALDTIHGVPGSPTTSDVTSNVWGLFTWPALRADDRLTGVDTSALLAARYAEQGLPVAEDDFEAGTNFVGPGGDLDAANEGRMPRVERAHVALDPNDPAPYRYKIDDQGTPRDIPEWRGRRVVLLTGRTRLARWRTLRPFPYLQGKLVVERVLSPAEVERYLGELRASIGTREYVEAECDAWLLAGISELNVSGAAAAGPILDRAFSMAESLGDGVRLLDAAGMLERACPPEREIAVWRRAVAAAESAAPLQRSHLKFRLGQAQLRAGEHEAAATSLGEAAAGYEALEDALWAWNAWRDCGRALGMTGRLAEADAAAVNAGHWAGKLDSPLERAERLASALTVRALIANARGDLQGAIAHKLAASRTWRMEVGDWHPELAYILEDLSRFYSAAGDAEMEEGCLVRADDILNQALFTPDAAGLRAVAASIDDAEARGLAGTAARRRARQAALRSAMGVEG